jgi:hypothetical protein
VRYSEPKQHHKCVRRLGLHSRALVPLYGSRQALHQQPRKPFISK